MFHIREQDSGLLYFKDLELHTIELKKFTNDSNEELADIIAKVKSSLDMWVTFLTRNDLLNKDNLPKELDNSNLKKALTVLDVMNFSESEREAYEDHLKWLRVETNTLKKYEQKGREEGIEIGEARRNTIIAENLLSIGLSVEDIVKVTNLPKELVEAIKAKKP